MATNQIRASHLGDELRARVEDCLKKEGLFLLREGLERLIRDIEASIAQFFATRRGGSSRDAHDALRALRRLAYEGDPPIGQLKARLALLPARAREYIGRRAPIVMQRRLGIDLGGPAGPGHAFDRFLAWTQTPEAVQQPEPPPHLPKPQTEEIAACIRTDLAEPVFVPPLVIALRALTSEGARPVEGRSRGGGKRSAPRLEPMIMGEVRGAGTARNRGGRPTNDLHQALVMDLAFNWLDAAGEPPKPGRTDNTGFGDLVHSVFQWLDLPEGSAEYALRQYWAAVSEGRVQGFRASSKP